MRRSAVLALMVALLFIVPATGGAAAPERYTDEFDFADTIDCSQFNPEWTFNDDFHDFFEVRGQVWLDENGDPIRETDHVHHVSTDVNSVTGFTLHEHNRFTVTLDFVKRHGDAQRRDQHHATPRCRRGHPGHGPQDPR